MLRRAIRLATAATSLALIGSLAMQPLARPYVERTAEDLRLHLAAASARVVDADWLAPRLEAALAAGDRDRVELLTGMAARYDVPLTHVQEAAVADALRPALGERLADCGACAYELDRCTGLADVVACNLPVELSPVGDVNALRRGAVAWWGERPVDGFEVALASVGLAATGLALATGGTSLSVKAGATLLRVGRRLGHVNARLAAVVAESVRDAAGIRALRVMAGDLDGVRRATSSTDAIALLRHVDGPADAARLARVADAAGPATRGHFEALGKARVLRATVRLTRGAAVFLALLAGLAVQVLLMLGSLLLRRIARGRRLRGAG